MKGMKRQVKSSSLLPWLLIVSLLLVPPSTAVAGAALAPVGPGPDSAQPPSGDWEALNPGEYPWYAFYYQGDGSPIEVRMQVVPEDGANFGLWTPEAIERWSLGLEADPIGRGSPEPAAGDNLLWTGSFTTEGTYYVIVEHTGSSPDTAYYLLAIEGPGISTSAPAPTATPAPTRTPTRSAPSQIAGRLVFQATVGGNFYVINVDGSGLRRLTDGYDPTWSPDGTEIAFSRWRDPRGVWVISADGSNEWRAFDWSETRWPTWSPDGSRILFSRQYGGRLEEVEKCFRHWCFTLPPEPHWRLGIVRTADGAFYEPPSSDFSRAPDWSAVDGGRIVYADGQGLRVQSEDGEVSYRITDEGYDTSPIWSPAGRRVVFTRRQHDHWEVYVVDADGRNLRRLTNTPLKPNGEVGHSAAATWSPDGTHIAFLTDRSGRWAIWVMDASGNEQRPMFEGELAGLHLEYGHIGERAISWTR